MFIRKDWLLIDSNEHCMQLMMSSASHGSIKRNEEDDDEELN